VLLEEARNETNLMKTVNMVPFPIDVFPPRLAGFCRAVAEATSTPPDFAGMTMLGTAAAAIGNSRTLLLKEGWEETPVLYLALVGDPATGKTPAMEAVLTPYEEMQQGLLARYTAERAAYDRKRRERDEIIKGNRAVAPEDRVPVPAGEPEPEVPERYTVTDTTVERLSTLLGQNPRGLLLRVDELLGWYRGMGQYKGGRGSDRQFWLSAWSRQSYLVDRVGKGVPLSIPPVRQHRGRHPAGGSGRLARPCSRLRRSARAHPVRVPGSARGEEMERERRHGRGPRGVARGAGEVTSPGAEAGAERHPETRRGRHEP
jgi:hypothetical protein